MSNEGREYHIYKRNCSLFPLFLSRLIFPHCLGQYSSFITLPAFRLFYYHYVYHWVLDQHGLVIKHLPVFAAPV